MRSLTWIPGLLALSGAFATADGAAPEASSGSAVAAHTPADVVCAALEQELGGRDADRNAILEQALDQDPEFAPAHWHLGHLNAGDQWVPYPRTVEEEEERRRQLVLYREERDARGDTLEDHVHLANWTREHGMPDEERAHLARIVELDSDNAQARRRLGDVKINGFWVAREEVEALAGRWVQSQQDLEAWSPDVQRIVRRLLRTRQDARERARQDLAAIHDPAAIPAVEQALSQGHEQAAGWYLEWLSGLDAWESSSALARQAVLSPSAAVRVRAQRYLRERPADHFVPMLLGAMRANLDINSRLFVTRFGGIAYVESILYETQDEVRSRSLAVLYGPEAVFTPRAPIPRGALPPSRVPEARAAVLSHLRNHYQAFDAREGRSLETATEIANQRASRTLAAALGIPELDSPSEWWDWWNAYQNFHVAGPKREVAQQFEQYFSTENESIRRTARRRIYVPYFPNPYVSCFAAGTPVLTEDGPKPIEDILRGDRVLAQDVDSGEIAFKPVFKTTIRPPVELLKVTTEDGELTCTNGHPLWINGLGWRYAWELEPGMRFHSVDGSSEIISVEDSGREEEAYNLVVADFHNYFVGEGRILSHDNSPRNPTNALVPGLMPDWSAPSETGQ